MLLLYFLTTLQLTKLQLPIAGAISAAPPELISAWIDFSDQQTRIVTEYTFKSRLKDNIRRQQGQTYTSAIEICQADIYDPLRSFVLSFIADPCNTGTYLLIGLVLGGRYGLVEVCINNYMLSARTVVKLGQVRPLFMGVVWTLEWVGHRDSNLYIVLLTILVPLSLANCSD